MALIIEIVGNDEIRNDYMGTRVECSKDHLNVYCIDTLIVCRALQFVKSVKIVGE